MRVKDWKKFSRFLLIVFLLIFTVSCGIKKIRAQKVTEPEMIKETIKISLENSENDIDKKKQLEPKVEEKKPPVLQKELNSQGYVFVKNTTLNVYSDETLTTRIGRVRKSTRVKVLEEKDVKVGEELKKRTKISYKEDLKEKEGWVSVSTFATDIKDTLPTSWSGLDFTQSYVPFEFENNKKVEVKGIYLNIYSIASEKKLEKLIKLANETEINTFVLDIKDDNGVLSFEMEAPKKFGISQQKSYPIKDIKAFMEKMKENNIYTIARIVTFKDPAYAKANPDKAIITRETGKPYTNSDGLIWVSAHDRNLWEYDLSVAEEAAKVGFNEIQFDYVRFPASNGGKLDSKLDYRNTMNESKPETIQKFLRYAKERLFPLEVYVSADVYGQVGTFKDDMGLGQHWEAVSQVVDYISPMMYPSHYGKGAYGVQVPDAEPYKIIYHSVKDSVNRNENIDHPAVIRPWIQAFTATWVKGHIKYNEHEIREQIRAMNDLGVREYLLWSPSNNYKITAQENLDV